MTELETKIFDYVKAHPGTRKRYIRSAVGCSLQELVATMDKMEKDGFLRSELYRDIGNMEFYDKWYVKKTI